MTKAKDHTHDHDTEKHPAQKHGENHPGPDEPGNAAALERRIDELTQRSVALEETARAQAASIEKLKTFILASWPKADL